MSNEQKEDVERLVAKLRETPELPEFVVPLEQFIDEKVEVLIERTAKGIAELLLPFDATKV